MLLTKAEMRQVILGGAVSLVGIAGFVGLATFALLLSSGASSILTAMFEPYILWILRFHLAAGSAFDSTVRRSCHSSRTGPSTSAAFPRPYLDHSPHGCADGAPCSDRALGLIRIWGRQGILNSLLLELGMAEPISIYGLSGILLAHVFFNMPLACRLMLAALERVPAEYWLMASGLGMRPGSIFRFIETGQFCARSFLVSRA